MCYLSTDRVIEDIPFDDNDGKFSHYKIEERPCHLTKRFVYACDAWEGCGCGFGRMSITEDILQRTCQQLQKGEFTEDVNEMIDFWCNQSQWYPDNMDEFNETADYIRHCRRDTIALYRLIEETCKAGFDCELLACWTGDENNPIDETFLVYPEHEQIDIDFRIVQFGAKTMTLLYRFIAATKSLDGSVFPKEPQV